MSTVHTDTRGTTARRPSTPVGLRPLTELQALESESIHIIRAVAATFAKPVMLFSGGKDSVVMLHLAAKRSGRPRSRSACCTVDTGHNFPRSWSTATRPSSSTVPSSTWPRSRTTSTTGRLRERPDGQRNPLQTVPLLDAIRAVRTTPCSAAGRRTRNGPRPRERVFSMRDEFRSVGSAQSATRTVVAV